MSDFVTGDPIQVRGLVSGDWMKGDRFFLAERNGRVFYADAYNDAYSATPDRVRAVPPKPLAVGDTAQVDGETVEIVAGPFTGYSEWYAVREAGNRQVRPCPAADLSREVPSTYTDPLGRVYRADRGYRDREGDVFRFTGRQDSVGVPFVSHLGNADSSLTIDYVRRQFGPLTEVA